MGEGCSKIFAPGLNLNLALHTHTKHVCMCVTGEMLKSAFYGKV